MQIKCIYFKHETYSLQALLKNSYTHTITQTKKNTTPTVN